MSYTQEQVEGAKRLVDAKGGSLSPLAKMYESKGYSSVPDAPAMNSSPTIGTTIGSLMDQLNNAKTMLDNFKASQSGAGASTGAGDLNLSTLDTEEEDFTPFDEEAARKQAMRDQLRLHQAEIDATNMIYDQLLSEARLQGQGRLGAQRAMAARGGLLGSDFASSQKGRVQDYNTSIYRGIGAERTAAIGKIMGTVRSSVLEEVKAKREAHEAGAQEYIDYLARKDERRANNLALITSDLIAQGKNPEDFSKEEWAEMLTGSGLKYNDVIAAYARDTQESLDDKKTKAEIKKIEADIESGKVKVLGEGSMLYNTETGEYFKNPKTATPSSTRTGGVETGDVFVTDEEIAQGHQTLQGARGDDGYTNTDVYLQGLQAWVDAKGDPKDYIKEYDPDIYINPKDPTRSFLKSQMQKESSSSFNFLSGIDINSAIQEATGSSV